MDGELHPELSLARYLPSLPVSDTLVKVYRYLTPSPKMSSDTFTGTKSELVDIPDLTGSRSVPACIVRPLGIPRLLQNDPPSYGFMAVAWYLAHT
jgi:hypothetical protein